MKTVKYKRKNNKYDILLFYVDTACLDKGELNN